MDDKAECLQESRKLAKLYKLFELVDDHSGRVRMEECDDTREQQLVEIGQWGRFFYFSMSKMLLVGQAAEFN